jgi:hypothetical protein
MNKKNTQDKTETSHNIVYS